MVFGLLILLIALIISAVAAFYSIAGLTTIFSAAVTPIIIMGASLEIGKIVATVWMHKYWQRMSLQFKLYLIPAILFAFLCNPYKYMYDNSIHIQMDTHTN